MQGTEALQPEDYIENGERLLRVIEIDAEGQALVEDCATLKVDAMQLDTADWKRVERV